MKEKGIVSAGNLIVDYVKIVDSYPRQGNLANISDISRSTGGAPTNVLIDLAKIDQDIPLCAIGLVGNDENGSYIEQQLIKNGIDTKMIRRHPLLGTSFTDVMSVKETGERTFFHYRGANAALGFANFDFSVIKADMIHIGYALLLDSLDAEDPEYGTVMAKTLAHAKMNGIKTSIDVVSENSDRFSKLVPPSLKYTDHCIINEVEASMITGINARTENNILLMDNIKRMCEELFVMGVSTWCVIHSPEMGCGMTEKGDFYIQPTVDIPREMIAGKVGAGDAFCSGILYSAYKQLDIKTALKIAAGAAVCSLTEANATDGMRSASEIMKVFESFPKMQL